MAARAPPVSGQTLDKGRMGNCQRKVVPHTHVHEPHLFSDNLYRLRDAKLFPDASVDFVKWCQGTAFSFDTVQ
jgi:hypothetical protein